MFLDDASLALPTPKGARTFRLGRAVLALGTVVAAGACHEKRSDPAAAVPNRSLGPMTIVVAPALNFSGAADFDPAVVADLMASELGYVRDVRVIPVSRALAVLIRQGRRQIESPEHAVEVTAQVGADAILVFAITEYDPYNPPIVGIAAQLYAVRPDAALSSADPVPPVEEGRPFTVSAARVLPIAQYQRVFDASHEAVAEDVKRFAGKRGEGQGPWGWKKHLVSQRHYLRYCCFATLCGLIQDHELSTVGALTER